MQVDTWFVVLRAVISRTNHHRMVDPLKSKRGASCISRPGSYMRRKQNLGLSAKTIISSQVTRAYNCIHKYGHKTKLMAATVWNKKDVINLMGVVYIITPLKLLQSLKESVNLPNEKYSFTRRYPCNQLLPSISLKMREDKMDNSSG